MDQNEIKQVNPKLAITYYRKWRNVASLCGHWKKPFRESWRRSKKNVDIGHASGNGAGNIPTEDGPVEPERTQDRMENLDAVEAFFFSVIVPRAQKMSHPSAL